MRIFHFPMAGIAVLALACLTGCATTVQLHYRTQPDGAQLYSSGRYLGVGAGSVGARLTKSQWNAGKHCVVMPPVRASWVSGTEVRTAPRRVCLQSFTGGVVYRDALIERPEDAPGLGMDLDYADQLARRRMAERQTRAVEAAAAAAAEEARARAHDIRLHERRERHEWHERDQDHYVHAYRDSDDQDHGDRRYGDDYHGERNHGDRGQGHGEQGDTYHGNGHPSHQGRTHSHHGAQPPAPRPPRSRLARPVAPPHGAKAPPVKAHKPSNKTRKPPAKPVEHKSRKTSGKDAKKKASGKARRRHNPKLLENGNRPHSGG